MKNLLPNRFSKDEHGSITAFILVLFLIMVVGGGMAVDFMRHETERAALQDAMDRGVLSAASFTRQFEEGTVTQAEEEQYVEDLVVSYLRSNTLVQRDIDFNIDLDLQDNSRRVKIAGEYDIKTFFLRIINIPTLTVKAYSTAETKRSEVEISLILDNSGSMIQVIDADPTFPNGARKSKMDVLKVAAKEFIDIMINEESIDHTAISIIPFSSSTNAGSVLASKYPNLDQWHNKSYCFEFRGGDFVVNAANMGISPDDNYRQEQHFFSVDRFVDYDPITGAQLPADQPLIGYSYKVTKGGVAFAPPTPQCPNAEILPLSNNKVALGAAIDNMQAAGSTASWTGMKWGIALLDPKTQPIVRSLVIDNVIDPLFQNRPAAWDDEDAAKFIILMTDGKNTRHVRMRNGSYNMSPGGWKSQANADYWDISNWTWGWNSLREDKDENIVPGWDYEYNGQHEDTPPVFVWKDYNDGSFAVNTATGDKRLDALCAAAKSAILGAKGEHIVIYTIGFDVEVGSNPYKKMQDCASSKSKFYHVTGTNLRDAFIEIAASIEKLRLVD